MEVDLSALAVIDEVVTELQKQKVEVFIASASARVAKSLEAYDLLDEVCACVGRHGSLLSVCHTWHIRCDL